MKQLLDKDRFGPWALVTGASSGIGKELSRQLAAPRHVLRWSAQRAWPIPNVGVSSAVCVGWMAKPSDHVTNHP